MTISAEALPSVLTCGAALEAALDDVQSIAPMFMTTADKAVALKQLGALGDRLDELRLRVMVEAGDVADQDGARDVAAWLSHHDRRDGGERRRSLQLAQGLGRWPIIAQSLRDSRINCDQAHVIVRALDALPGDVAAELLAAAEIRLVREAGHFGPRALRVMGRRILEVVAPDLSEGQEATWND